MLAATKTYVIESVRTGEPVDCDTNEIDAWEMGETIAAMHGNTESFRLIEYTLH